MSRTNGSKFHVGQKVVFKSSYNGTFSGFKDRILTIKEIIPQTQQTDDVGVKIVEIEEVEKYHLIMQGWLESSERLNQP